MPRERSPNRDKAFEIWRDSGGKIPLKDIAEQLGVSDIQVRKWKNQDNWEKRLNGNGVTNQNGNVTNQRNSNVTKKIGPPLGNQNAKGHGAPRGNKNAVGNRGGPGGPVGNKKAEKHGFFSRIFPDDPETQEIIESINIKSPLEMLWENIVIQYTAIARAQRLMFVRSQDDMTKEKSAESDSDIGYSRSYKIQFAWEKHAAFLQAQSKAMTTLQNMLARYEEMLRSELATEEQRLKLEKMKAEINKINAGGDGKSDKLTIYELTWQGQGEEDGNSQAENNNTL